MSSECIYAKACCNKFLTNLHVGAVDSNNIALAIIYSQADKTSYPYIITLTGKYTAARINIISYVCDFDSYMESISVYKRIFLLQNNNTYANSNTTEKLLCELLYNAEEDGWQMERKSSMFLTHYSLVSVLSRIYSLGDKLFNYYDINIDKWCSLAHTNIKRSYPLLFARNSRYIYAVMGHSSYHKVSRSFDYDKGEIAKSFEVFDLMVGNTWTLYSLNTKLRIVKCKCMYASRNEIIVLGGDRAAEVISIKMDNVISTLEATHISSAIKNDTMISCMNPVQWCGVYYLCTNNGNLYSVNKAHMSMQIIPKLKLFSK